MLVLSRKLGEAIIVNNNIKITVVDIDRGKIRLGIEAPRDVPIFRKELLTGDTGGKPSIAHGNTGAEPMLLPEKPVETKRVHGDCPTCTCQSA